MIVLSMTLAATAAGLAVHECGHWWAARALGYDARIVVRWLGPGTVWATCGRRPSRRHRMVVSAAGPAASVAAAVWMVAWWTPCWPLAVVVANVGLLQLLPLPRSDGMSLLRMALMR